LFVSDDLRGDVAAFVYPGLTLVGYYNGGNLPYPAGIGLAASGDHLYSAFNDNSSQAVTVDSWQIGEGCQLPLALVGGAPAWMDGMGITPNGLYLLLALLWVSVQSEFVGACVQSQGVPLVYEVQIAALRRFTILASDERIHHSQESSASRTKLVQRCLAARFRARDRANRQLHAHTGTDRFHLAHTK
jgi:hypothetical protein